MEAVPDIIQLADDEAQGKEQEQQNGQDFLPGADFLGGKELHRQNTGEYAAVEIGQTLLKGGLLTTQIAEDLTQGVQQAQEGVLGGNVEVKFGRELIKIRHWLLFKKRL